MLIGVCYYSQAYISVSHEAIILTDPENIFTPTTEKVMFLILSVAVLYVSKVSQKVVDEWAKFLAIDTPMRNRLDFEHPYSQKWPQWDLGKLCVPRCVYIRSHRLT